MQNFCFGGIAFRAPCWYVPATYLVQFPGVWRVRAIKDNEDDYNRFSCLLIKYAKHYGG